MRTAKDDNTKMYYAARILYDSKYDPLETDKGIIEKKEELEKLGFWEPFSAVY